MLLDKEATYVRRAWTGSEDMSTVIEAHVRTLENVTLTEAEMAMTAMIHELAEKDRMFPEESDEVKKYVSGLPDMIHRSVKASMPKTMQKEIEFATELMDQKILTLAERHAKKKRNNSLKLRNQNQGNLAGNGNAVAKAYDVGTARTNLNSNVATDVPIVQEFPEVFPEDLPGIPPTGQVKFQIDLIPCAAPVAQEPYRLAPSETKELSYQLKELSDEDFIRPGLAGYYQRFIKRFSNISKSMTMLTQKKVKFDWGDKEKAAFQLIKQKEKMIAYASRQVKIHEKNYTTLDLELGALVLALKIWRHYLYGTKCTVFTDYKSLQHILDQKELNMRQRYWLELLSDYDCEIRYHPGKANDNITMDFVTKLPRTPSGYDIIWTDGQKRKDHSDIRRYVTYDASIKATSFEALYARKCRSPVCWADFRDAQLTGSELIHETTEKIVQIKQRIQVSPWKGVIRFGKRGKLNPRYIRPFKPLAISLDIIHIDDKLHFVEEPRKIMDREVKWLKQSRIPIIKVRWNSRKGPEFTWEREDQFQKKYPHLFTKTAPSTNATS
uniref:Putative reverse transcriptase domain-containing protein n=1 Tax=Tanacetum cinerariifolium TaxID=118510 RepID=A0A6L2KEI0_TANCI|nr:putative reverse transcriptase domain-containing protein [Tanacetum cinerariifolium]